jgi:hypothetical protein
VAESADPYRKGGRRGPSAHAIPLVYYEGFTRHVVGSAILKPDGSFTGQISENSKSNLRQIFEDRRLTSMSFLFQPPLLNEIEKDDPVSD